MLNASMCYHTGYARVEMVLLDVDWRGTKSYEQRLMQ